MNDKFKLPLTQFKMLTNQKFNMSKSMIVICLSIGIYVSNCQISIGQNYNRRPFLWSPPIRSSPTLSPSSSSSSLPSTSNFYASRPRPSFNILQPFRPLLQPLYQPLYQPQPQPQPRPPTLTSINNNRVPSAPSLPSNNNGVVTNNGLVRRPVIIQPSTSTAQRRPSPAQTWRWALGRRAQWRPRTTIPPERLAPLVMPSSTNSTILTTPTNVTTSVINEQPALPNNVTPTPLSQPVPVVEPSPVQPSAGISDTPTAAAAAAAAAAANGEF